MSRRAAALKGLKPQARRRSIVVGSIAFPIISATFAGNEMTLRLTADKKSAAEWAILMNTAFLQGGKGQYGEELPPVARIDVVPAQGVATKKIKEKKA